MLNLLLSDRKMLTTSSKTYMLHGEMKSVHVKTALWRGSGGPGLCGSWGLPIPPMPLSPDPCTFQAGRTGQKTQLRCLAPCHPCGRLHCILGFWLQKGSAPAVPSKHLGVKQGERSASLSLPGSLPNGKMTYKEQSTTTLTIM